MGRFLLTPQKGKKYFAVVKSRKYQFAGSFAASMEKGLVMHVVNSSKTLDVTLHANKAPTNDRIGQ